MKKIDKLVLDAFIGPFIITFLVVVFILLNINMLKYFDDIFGKGLDGILLAQLFFYFAIFTIPTALPLAVLLSSLIAFGNLGEHFELTAIKSAGVSLIRSMFSIFVFVLLLTGAAFYANNNLVPLAALEAYSLLYDIKQKKPALELREGAFFNGINDISIKVDYKYPDGITLKNVIVYDHRKNDGNKEVTVADSGKMYTVLNDRYMKFELYNGYNYTEGAGSERELTGQKGKKNSETLTRSKFTKTQVVFDVSSLGGDVSRTDKKWFQGNRIMRNLSQLESDQDSISREILSQKLGHYQYQSAHFSYYRKSDQFKMPVELVEYKKYRDSVAALPYTSRPGVEFPTNSTPQETPRATPKGQVVTNDSVQTNQLAQSKLNKFEKSSSELGAQKRSTESFVKKRKLTQPPSKKEPKKNNRTGYKKNSQIQIAKKEVVTDSMITARIDSLFNMSPTRETYAQATNAARQVKSQIENANTQTTNYQNELIIYDIQWHKILASSFACIAMFMIGAPLGSIIKRGGLGVPFLVSIVFFIVYYILTMQGEKLAKQGALDVISGVWGADVILFFVGLFFLRQARVDARILEADFYRVTLEKLNRRLSNKKAVPIAPVIK